LVEADENFLRSAAKAALATEMTETLGGESRGDELPAWQPVELWAAAHDLADKPVQA
jgi:hypothetical protein